jgi:hypothetical protein
MFVSISRYGTKAKALPAAAQYDHNLREVLPELRSDKDIVLAAVSVEITSSKT